MLRVSSSRRPLIHSPAVVLALGNKRFRGGAEIRGSCKLMLIGKKGAMALVLSFYGVDGLFSCAYHQKKSCKTSLKSCMDATHLFDLTDRLILPKRVQGDGA